MARDVRQRFSSRSIRTMSQAALVLGLGLSACAPKPAPQAPPPLALTELRLSDSSPAESDPMLTARASIQLRQALQAEFPRRPDARECKGELGAGYQRLQAKEGAQASVEVRLMGDIHCQRLAPDTTVDSFRLALSDEKAVSEGTLESTILAMYGQLAGELGKTLRAQVQVRPLATPELLALLQLDTDLDVLLEALTEVIDRKLSEAEPHLYTLALHTNPLVLARIAAAIGALKLNTHEAHRTLARFSTQDHPGVLLATLHAFSDLNTPESRKYLSDLAKKHPFDQVRTLAHHLLEREAQPTY